MYIRKVKKADRSLVPINILIIPKEGFNEDVFSCLGQDERFNIYTIYRMVTKALAEGILHHSIDDHNYISDDPDVEATNTVYRNYLSNLQQRDLDGKKNLILEKWVGNAYGLARERVRNAVLEEII